MIAADIVGLKVFPQLGHATSVVFSLTTGFPSSGTSSFGMTFAPVPFVRFGTTALKAASENTQPHDLRAMNGKVPAISRRERGQMNGAREVVTVAEADENVKSGFGVRLRVVRSY